MCSLLDVLVLRRMCVFSQPRMELAERSHEQTLFGPGLLVDPNCFYTCSYFVTS